MTIFAFILTKAWVREKILLNRKKIVGEIIFDYDKADKELSNALSINIKE